MPNSQIISCHSKQFGPRLGQTFCWTELDPKMFDIDGVPEGQVNAHNYENVEGILLWTCQKKARVLKYHK